MTLVLSRVAKEDVDRTYYLTVANDLGREDFSVRLSTMDEPAGKSSFSLSFHQLLKGSQIYCVLFFYYTNEFLSLTNITHLHLAFF